MMPEALIHMPVGALEHRFIVAGERSRKQDDDTADATRALREMLSDGRLTKLIPVKRGNEIETVQIDQPGPIAYVESTTLQSILDEDRNRCLILATDETPHQTRRVISLLGERKSRTATVDDTRTIIAKHHAAQRMLCRRRVVIPFAPRLASLFPNERTDARRTFGQLLSTIEGIALLHQFQRTENPADGAAIEATTDDYRLACWLLAGPFSRAQGDGLSDAARRFGERLRQRFEYHSFDSRDIAKCERIIGDVQVIRKYLRALANACVITCIDAARGPIPAQYQFGADDDVPSARTVLPSVEEVFGHSSARQNVSDVANVT